MAGAGERVSSGLRAEPRLTPAADALLHTDVPVIAAVNGAAVVGYGARAHGRHPSRPSAVRRAVRRQARTELRRGGPGAAGAGRRTRVRGRIAVHGPDHRCRRGLDIGLVSRVVSHEELLPAALAPVTEIATNPPLAVQRMKQGLREALDPDWNDLGRWVTVSLAELFGTEDHREGVAALLEKRNPTTRASDARARGVRAAPGVAGVQHRHRRGRAARDRRHLRRRAEPDPRRPRRDRHVVRRPPIGHFLPTAHDMGREYTVYRALHGTAVPVPMLALHRRECDRRAVLRDAAPRRHRAPRRDRPRGHDRRDERFPSDSSRSSSLSMRSTSTRSRTRRLRQARGVSRTAGRPLVRPVGAIEDRGHAGHRRPGSPALGERMPQHWRQRSSATTASATSCAARPHRCWRSYSRYSTGRWRRSATHSPTSHTLLYWSTTHRPLATSEPSHRGSPGLPHCRQPRGALRTRERPQLRASRLLHRAGRASSRSSAKGRARAIRTGRPTPSRALSAAPRVGPLAPQQPLILLWCCRCWLSPRLGAA